MEGDSSLAECSKLNRHVQMKVAEGEWMIRMRNSEWCIGAGSKDEVKHVGRIDESLSDDDGLMRVT